MNDETPGETADAQSRRAGGEPAGDEMLSLVYAELRRLAASHLRCERPHHTLQATALVHEAYLRMADQRVDWRNRAHFVGVASIMMRRVLVNYARERSADKRGAGVHPEPLTVAGDVAIRSSHPIDVLHLDAALERLAAIDGRKARVVELKVFGGLNTDEMAEVVGVSPATIERDWTFARAWLADQLS